MVRIIAIDDSPALQRLLQGAMRGTAVSVESYLTGCDGVTAALENPPALVVVDLDLPDRTGWEVLERLRSNPSTAEIPVIVTTADAGEGNAGRAAELEALTLQKPYTGEVLRATVHLMTTGSPAQQAAS